MSYTRRRYFHCLFFTPVKIIRGLCYTRGGYVHCLCYTSRDNTRSELHKRGICPLSLLHQRGYCLCLSYTRGGYFHCLSYTSKDNTRSDNIAFVFVTTTIKTSPRGRILGRNPGKRKFSSFALRFLFIQTHATSYSFRKGEWSKKPDRKPYPLPYGLRNPYRNIKTGNYKDNAQEPQWNCTFMNSASGLHYNRGDIVSFWIYWDIWVFVSNSDSLSELHHRNVVLYALQRNLDLCMPRIGIARFQSHFHIHVSVWVLSVEYCPNLSFIHGILSLTEWNPWDIVLFWVTLSELQGTSTYCICTL